MIDYKTIHRKYKIANILGKEFNDEIFNKIYNHYKKNMDISKMKIFIEDNYPDTIFYGYSKDDIYIEYDIKTNIFWLDNNKIWSFFETEFGYNYQEIKELTKTILKEHLNLKVVSTYMVTFSEYARLKEHLNLKVVSTGSVGNLTIN